MKVKALFGSAVVGKLCEIVGLAPLTDLEILRKI